VVILAGLAVLLPVKPAASLHTPALEDAGSEATATPPGP
jgi:hypothetical protein